MISKLQSFLIMGSSFGATTISSYRCLLPIFLSGCSSTRSAAAFALHPAMMAHQQQYFGQQQARKIHNGPFFSSTILSASSKNGNENGEVTPTWQYIPYDQKKKSFKKPKPTITWKVPKHVSIPEDRLEISFVRSSGSGGQNVNKLSTKVELRLDLNDRQPWMPAEVQRRLKEQQTNKISKEGILSITAQEHRTQGMNRKSAVDKLRKMVLAAWPRPKVRKQRTGISRAAKARNKDFKKRRSETKQNRKRVNW